VRVLLDECLPRRLKRELLGHDARTAPEMGWASKRNGELLALAAGAFDVFLTVDRNLSYRRSIPRAYGRAQARQHFARTLAADAVLTHPPRAPCIAITERRSPSTSVVRR
jgi:hypothetical protein